MRAAILGGLLAALASVGQNTESKPTVPQELPPERITDTYCVYDATLRNPFPHNGQLQEYFIADRTGQTYGIADPDKCIVAPEADRQALKQAVDDFRTRNGKVYRIVNRFNLNERQVHLLNDEKRLAPETGIIRLSDVGFSNDRSLAIVVVSHYCGTLCGTESWRIFKRSKDKWVEQQWTKCEIVSSLLQIRDYAHGGQ